MYCTLGIVCTQVKGCKSNAPAVALIAGRNWCFVSSSSLFSLAPLPSIALFHSLVYMSVCYHSRPITPPLFLFSLFYLRLFCPPPLCIPLCPRRSNLPDRSGKAEGWGTGSIGCAEGRVGCYHPQGRSNECPSQSDPN